MNVNPAVGIRPVVTWPREVYPGQNYLITVDLATELMEQWPYELEEYAVTCLVDSSPWCQVESHGSSTLLLHRFGGTYGPIQFIAHVGQPERGPLNPIRLTFVTAGGLPFHTVELPLVVTNQSDATVQRRLMRPAQPRPAASGGDGSATAQPSRIERLSPVAEETGELIRRQTLMLFDRLRLPHADISRSVTFDDLYVEPLLQNGPLRATLDTLTQQAPRVVVLGDPGSGKSTVLTRLACTAVMTTEQIPLVISLREIGPQDATVVDMLVSICIRLYGVHVLRETLEEILTAGRALLLLDGLDEMVDPDARRSAASLIDAAAVTYPKIGIVITARRLGYREVPLNDDLFSVAELIPFNHAQVVEYARKWFRLDDESPTGEPERMTAMFLQEIAAVGDLAPNPLMLSLLCALYRSDGFIPRNRPEVIERCAQMMFETWDRARGIETLYMFNAHLRGAVQRLAWRMFEGDKSWLTRSQALKTISGYLHERQFEDEDETLAAANQFLDYCAGRAWIITDVGSSRSEPLYGFTHRTFLEFFCAEHLVRQNRNPAILYRAIEPRLNDARWHSVTEIAAQLIDRGIEDGANTLLDAALRSVIDLPTNQQLDTLSYCARVLDLVPIASQLVNRIVFGCVAAAGLTPAQRKQASGKLVSGLADRPLADLLACSLPDNSRKVYAGLEIVLEHGTPAELATRAFALVNLHRLFPEGDERWADLQLSIVARTRNMLSPNSKLTALQTSLMQHDLRLAEPPILQNNVSPLFDSYFFLGRITPPVAYELLVNSWPSNDVWLRNLSNALLAAPAPWTDEHLRPFALQAALDLAETWPKLPRIERSMRIMLCLPFLEDLANRNLASQLGNDTIGALVSMRASRTIQGLGELSLGMSPDEAHLMTRWLTGEITLVNAPGPRKTRTSGRSAPLFFVSYARPKQHSATDEHPRREVARLFEDLCDHVRELTGHDNPGFIDLSMGLGDPWRMEVLDALGNCQVFVALLSPALLNDEWCGQEWGGFAQRRTTPREGVERSSRNAILPVAWTPLNSLSLPDDVRTVQIFRPQTPARDSVNYYQEDGIYGLLKTGRQEAYQSAVWRLAREIVQTSRAVEVGPQVLRPDTIQNAFESRS